MMIADEGFEIKFAGDALGVSASATPSLTTKEPLSLFAFSRYELQTPKGKTGAALAMKDVESRSVSKCGETILGWYALGRERWGCWKGTRVASKSAPPKSTPAVLQTVAAAHRAKGNTKHLSFAQASLRVQRINARQGVWKA